MMYTAWNSLFNEEEQTTVDFNAFTIRKRTSQPCQVADVRLKSVTDSAQTHYFSMYFSGKAIKRLELAEGKAIEFGLKQGNNRNLYIRSVTPNGHKKKGQLALRLLTDGTYSVRIAGAEMVAFLDDFVHQDITDYPLFYDKLVKGDNFMICADKVWDENRVKWGSRKDEEEDDYD